MLARGARVAQGKETPSPSAFAGGERWWVREEGGSEHSGCGWGVWSRYAQGVSRLMAYVGHQY